MESEGIVVHESAFALVNPRRPIFGTSTWLVLITDERDRDAAGEAARVAAARFTAVTSDGRELVTDEEWDAYWETENDPDWPWTPNYASDSDGILGPEIHVDCQGAVLPDVMQKTMLAIAIEELQARGISSAVIGGAAEMLRADFAERLDRLQPAAQRLVAGAALLGQVFSRHALAAVTPLPLASLDALLAELVSHAILSVETDPQPAESIRYRFADPVYAEAAYELSSPRERKAGHLAMVAYLERAFADGRDDIADDIAEHLRKARLAIPDDPDVPQLRERAAEILVTAGNRLEQGGALADASDRYRKAAEVLALFPDPEHTSAAARLLDRAGHLGTTAGREGTFEIYDRAAQMYRRCGKWHDAARADAEAQRARTRRHP